MPAVRLALAVLLCAAPAPAADFTGKVVAVIDGDTITVLRGAEQVRVRLHGIDCPELRQDFGDRAKRRTSQLAFGEAVVVREVDTDRYGRTVAEVVLPGGDLLHRELARAGLAWWDARYAPDDRVLRLIEAEARAARRGLWSRDDAVPPWEWRAERRKGAAAP